MSIKPSASIMMGQLRERFQPGGIGRHISWLLLHSGVEAGTMTVAALLAARWFGPAAWGQLGILLTGVQLISMMSDGLYGTIMKFVSEGRALEDAGVGRLGWRLIWVTVFILLGASVLMGGAATVIFSSQLSLAWVCLAVVLATSRGWRAAFDGAYRGLQEFRTPAIAGMVCSTVMAGCIIGLTASGYRVGGYLAVMVAGSIANCLWLVWAYQKKFLQSGRSAGKHPAMYQDFFQYSAPLAMRGILSFLFLKINVWILGWLATDADAGQFRLTDQFLTIPALILSATLAAVAPRIAEAQLRGPESLGQFLAKVYGFMLVLTLPLALFFWLNGPLMHWLFPAFGTASKMLVLFAPAMAVQGLGYAASIVLVQGGQPKAAFWVTLFSAAGNLTGAYIGFKAGGVMGLTVATAIVHFFSYVVTVLVTHSVFGLKFRVRFY